MDPVLYVLAWLALYWPHIVGGLFLIACALVGYAAVAINKTPEPKVKPLDVIDEEIRREKLELYNTSLDYAALQFSPPTEGVRTTLYREQRVREMLSAAFRSGARWQANRDR